MFAQAVQGEPESAEAWFGWGWALHLTGDERGAEAKYLRAAALAFDDPKLADTAYFTADNLASLALHQLREVEALGVLQRASTLRPAEPSVLARMGRLFLGSAPAPAPSRRSRRPLRCAIPRSPRIRHAPAPSPDNERAGSDRHFSALDGLRGAAVLLVIGFHASRVCPEADAASARSPWITAAGWAGVDLFFTLSGFPITRILVLAKESPSYFWSFDARRTLRIFPLYYAALGAFSSSARSSG